MDNQVKELACTICLNECKGKFNEQNYDCNLNHKRALQAIEAGYSDSHPSSQSLKRIENIYPPTFYDEDKQLVKSNLWYGFENGADKQLAADHPVVAELEKQIAEVKKENAEVWKQANEGADIISHQMDEIKALKAQLQPVEGEVETLLDEFLKKSGNDPEHVYTKEYASKLSALIKSREGKVAGEGKEQ